MAYTYITQYSSPNYTPAENTPRVYGGPRQVAGITIHHWGADGQTFQGVVNYLCRRGGNTSAHYVVEAGQVACIVDPDDTAWHAGHSTGNRTTIGIECRPEATDQDYETVAELVRDLRAVYGPIRLYGHRDWKNTACPGRWDLHRIDLLAKGLPAPKPSTGGGTSVPVVTKPKPKPKPAPVKYRTGKVPGTNITVVADGVFGTFTKKAYQQALRNAGYRGHKVDGDFGRYSVISEQQWLRDRGQRGHAVDGDRGRYTIRSLQAHLRSLGYTGHAVDDVFGRYTITSLQHALLDGKVK